MSNKVRVKISSDSIAETVVAPVFDATFQRKVERDRIYYTHELKGKITFTGSDFTLIKDLADDCEKITLVVERYCSSAWSEYWTGKFTKFDCKFNFYECTVEADIRPDNTYQCIFDVWDTQTNIYGSGDEVQVQEVFGTYQSGLDCCYECKPPGSPFDPVCTSSTACEEITVYNEVTTAPEYPGDCAVGDYQAYTCFHRILGTGTPTVPPAYGSGWTLLSGSTWWRCPDDTYEPLTIGLLRRGRRFDDVLEYIISQLGCGLTLRSHFFNINATHAAPPSNDAYDYSVQYQDMIVFQKSDVKRPFGDPSFSFIWNMKVKELLADLQTIFNVFWKLDGTDLILEHISYFEADTGADYTTTKMALELDYDLTTPKEERFIWSDEDCSTEFKGKNITYNCGNGTKERKVSLFSTDVEFVRTEAYQDRIADDNWVLLSCTFTGGPSGIYFINDKNRPLSWTKLHDKLHRHWRPFASGTLNDNPETFLSVEPIKRQPDFTVQFCCDTDFDPSKSITTRLGVGRVQSAEENLKLETLKLQLNYP